jgi:hypothetical protein
VVSWPYSASVASATAAVRTPHLRVRSPWTRQLTSLCFAWTGEDDDEGGSSSPRGLTSFEELQVPSPYPIALLACHTGGHHDVAPAIGVVVVSNHLPPPP